MSFFSEKLDLVQKQAQKTFSELTGRISLFSEVINGIPFLASTEKSMVTKYDEKHYFVIPFKLSDHEIVLHTMRCLPNGVPEANNLPKRRVFHFYNEYSEEQLRQLLMEQAEDCVIENNKSKMSSLENLANDIDTLDNKLTYGMLLVGGLSAFVNPILGASIVAKAILPSASGLLNKHGLRPLGEKLTKSQIQSQIKNAQKNIQLEFEASNTLKIINPILQELELALRTTELEHDPLLDFDLSSSDINELDSGVWRDLTIVALKHVYDDVLKDTKTHQRANLGPEDLRWFKVLFAKK